MKKFLFFSLAAAALLSGCAKSVEDEAIEAPLRGTRVVTLKAAAETTDSKVAYAGETTFGWQAGDCIGLYVYDHANDSRLYVPADFAGNDGDTNGDFTLTLAADQDYYKVAWYPYFEVSADWTDAGVLTLDFNSQKAFSTLMAGEMPMPMVAYFPDDTDKASLQFKNVGGLVKITVQNVPANAKYFKLVADKQISGPFTLDLENDQLGTVECTLQPGSVGSNAIEYIYEDGATTELNLYYPVPVGNFKFGFEIYTEAGIVVYKKEIEATSNENTIERGDILRMPAITVTDATTEYKLIGYREGDETWSTNLDPEAVANQYGWFVFKDIKPGPAGNVQFKFRKGTSWADADVFGLDATEDFFQVPGTQISLAHPGKNITFVGYDKSYDIYFNEAEAVAFALPNLEPFAVPTEVSTNNYPHFIGSSDKTSWDNEYFASEPVAGYDAWRVIKNIPVNGDSNITFKLRSVPNWSNDAYIFGAPTADVYETNSVIALNNPGGDIKIQGVPGDSFDVYVNSTDNKVVVLKSGETFEYPIVSFQRIVGKVPVGLGQPWTTDYATASFPIVKNDRSAATDGEWAFVVCANETPGILAINLNDPTVTKELDVTTMTGGYLKVASLNTIKDPSTGKYILLACSLSEYKDGATDGYELNIYAYKDGIDAAPTRILNFKDSQGRHLGEIFSVVGDWHEGEIWVRNRFSPSTLCWPINDGVLGSPLGGAIGYDGSKGLGAVYKYGMGSNQVLLENESLGLRYNLTVSSWIESFAGVLWAGKDQSVMGRKYGVTPFELDGKKYIAYTQVGKYADPNNGARARLKVIEDLGGADNFGPSIEADNILYEYPIQNLNDNATSATDFDEVLFSSDPSYILDNRILASCSVAKIDNTVYILSHCYNVGLSVFKFTVSK